MSYGLPLTAFRLSHRQLALGVLLGAALSCPACTHGTPAMGVPAKSTQQSLPVDDCQGDAPPLPQYEVVELQLGSATNAVANRINNHGLIIGMVVDRERRGEAAIWNEGRLVPLGDLAGIESHAFAVNDHGQVGGMAVSEGRIVPFIWHNGTTRLLPPHGDHPEAILFGIAGNGEACGSAGSADQGEAFYFDGKQYTKLPTLGGPFARVNGMGRTGVVVGESSLRGGPAIHAVVWRKGVAIDLGAELEGNSKAYGVNERGMVVGGIVRGDGSYSACLWKNGKPRVLDCLPEGDRSWSFDCNDRDEVVGWSSAGLEAKQRGVVWLQERIVDLNDLILPHSGWIILSARSINERGDIVAVASRYGINPRPVWLKRIGSAD